jgi:hypothetical protein
VLAVCVALPWTVLPAHTAFAEASSYITGASAAGPWVVGPTAPEFTAFRSIASASTASGSAVEPISYPVKVAIVDTGVRRDRLPEGASVEPGRNYVFEDKDTTDVVGHGTRIAGIILDIAPDVTLVPLVYYSQYPSGVPANGGVAAICRAIYDAIDVYGCRVINVSSGLTVDDEALREAVRYAEEKGVIVVSAVGNDRVTAPERVFYPAAYETVIGVGAVSVGAASVGAISVGAISAEVESAPFSQANSSVTVVAPGKDLRVISIRSSTGTETLSGTSYASAHVAAEAALFVSAYPGITPAEFRQVLKTSSRDLGDPGYDEIFGWGYVDAGSGATALAYERMLRVKALPFSDVSISDWFCDPVLDVYQSGLMLGVSPDSFEPGRPVTWEMVSIVLHRLHARYAADSGEPPTALESGDAATAPSGNAATRDVAFTTDDASTMDDAATTDDAFTRDDAATTDDAFTRDDASTRDDAAAGDTGVASDPDTAFDSAPYLDWFIRAGLAAALGDAAPDLSDSGEAATPITREALCTVLVEYCRYAGIDLSGAARPGDALPGVALPGASQADGDDPSVTPSAFADIDQASDWALESMAIARAAGIMRGSGGYFRPANTTTRAELATVLVRLLAQYSQRDR